MGTDVAGMGNSAGKILIVVGALVLAAAVIVVMQILPGRDGGGVRIGGPFTLVDQNGRTLTDKDFRGAFMLVYFGYTYCPDVCPTALNQMGIALDGLGTAADKVRPVFITVDPERDTPERLKEYARNFHPRLVALTGDAAAVAAAAKAYRVYYARAKDGATGDGYLMDHSSIVFLMDPDGRYVTHFTHGTDADQMAAQIRDRLP